MKKTKYLFMALILAASLTACGKDNASQPENLEKDNSVSGTIAEVDDSNVSGEDASEENVSESGIIDSFIATSEIVYDGKVSSWGTEVGNVTIYKPEGFYYNSADPSDDHTLITMTGSDGSLISIDGASSIIADYDAPAMSQKVLSTKTATNKDGATITICDVTFTEEGNGTYNTKCYYLPLSNGNYLRFWYYTEAAFNSSEYTEQIKDTIPSFSEETMLTLTCSDFVVTH